MIPEKTLEIIREEMKKRYGSFEMNPNSFGGQRDGFIEGAKVVYELVMGEMEDMIEAKKYTDKEFARMVTEKNEDLDRIKKENAELKDTLHKIYVLEVKSTNDNWRDKGDEILGLSRPKQ